MGIRQHGHSRGTYERGRAAPVQKQNRLLVAAQRTGKAILKLAAEDRPVALLELAAHIDQAHWRQWQHLRTRKPCGSRPIPTRSLSASSVKRPARAASKLSTDGVALPRINTLPVSSASFSAVSRAW